MGSRHGDANALGLSACSQREGVRDVSPTVGGQCTYRALRETLSATHREADGMPACSEVGPEGGVAYPCEGHGH